MAITSRIRTGYDTWVGSGSPSLKHPGTIRLRVNGSSKYAFIYFPLGPELRGATIQSATLRLYGREAGWGPQTLTFQPITQRWDAATLTWNNKPTVGTTTATLTQSNPTDPTEWVVDVTALVQEYASGSPWRGLRMSTAANFDLKFNSLNADSRTPWLEVVWTEAPAAPVDLSPSGGRAVSVPRPTLSWSNENTRGGLSLTAFQVQIDPAANGTTPAFSYTQDPAEVAEVDLSQTAYVGLADGAATQWRVRVKSDNLWSDWSDWSTFTRVDKGTVTVTTPGSTVVEYTPPVAWTTSFTQTAWQVQVLDADDPTKVLHNTGRQTGTTQDYTIPARDTATGRRILVDGRNYILHVDAFDAVDRETTPGDPRFVRASQVFNYADDPTPNQVTSLSATQVAETPYVDLTWQRATTPDSWTIIDNGRVIETNIDGPDLLVSGTSYKFRYKYARPGDHEFQVKPTANALTAGSPTVFITTESTGLWIMGPDGIDVPIGVKGDSDAEFGAFSMADRATTFILPGVRTPVRVTQGVGGYGPSQLSGWLWDTAGRTARQWADRLLEVKKLDEQVALFLGEDVIQARVFDILVEPSRDGGRTIPVALGFFQVGPIDWLD